MQAGAGVQEMKKAIIIEDALQVQQLLQQGFDAAEQDAEVASSQSLLPSRLLLCNLCAL